MEYLAGYFRYWGKADPAVETGGSWHPLVYHCLDVGQPVAAQLAIDEALFIRALGGTDGDR